MTEEPNMTLRQVGRRMGLLREKAGIGLRAVVAEGLVGSKDTLQRLETGKRTTLLFSNIRDICEFYGADPELVKTIVTWYRNSDRPWGEAFAGAVLKDLHRLIEMEEYVSELFIYESNLITGLAQTETYARSAHERDPDLSEETIAKSLEVRLKRQRIYWGRNPLPVTRILMGETALLGACGREQIDLLKELPADVRVLPNDDGPYPSLRGPFMIFRFADPADPDCVYTEGLEGSRYDSKSNSLDAYDRLFRSSFDQATPMKEF